MEYKIFQNNHPHLFTILSNTSNIGAVANIEKAIQNAKGDLIVLSDQDDIWEPNKLSMQILHIREDIPTLVSSRRKYIDSSARTQP